VKSVSNLFLIKNFMSFLVNMLFIEFVSKINLKATKLKMYQLKLQLKN